MTNSDVLMNPSGGEAGWRGTMQPALETNLMEQVLASENLHRAWKQVKSNKGAPGIDGLCLEDFPAYAQLHWEEICQSLRAGKYQPTPVRRVVIPKPGGKGERLLGVVQATEWGTPQGSPLSPLLANILLDDLDQELERRGHRFARYVDDVVILVKSSRAGRRVMASVTRYLTQVLRLKVNPLKSRVCRIERLEYLSFRFQGIRTVGSERAFEDFKHRLRGLTSRRWRVSMEYRLERISLYLRGWMGYFGISQLYGPIPELDLSIRQKLLKVL